MAHPDVEQQAVGDGCVRACSSVRDARLVQGLPVGEHLIVVKLPKDMCNDRPPQLKCMNIWNVGLDEERARRQVYESCCSEQRC